MQIIVMFFDKNKKPKASLESLTAKTMELEERLNSLVSLLQDDCPVLRNFLRQKDEAEEQKEMMIKANAERQAYERDYDRMVDEHTLPKVVIPVKKVVAYKPPAKNVRSQPIQIPEETEEERENEVDEISRIMKGKPSKKAKQIIRI